MKWLLVIFGSTDLLELSYVLGGVQNVWVWKHMLFSVGKTKVAEIEKHIFQRLSDCLKLLPHETPKDVSMKNEA